jgi:hypothetical protein
LSPLSTDPERRSRQLATLQPGRGAAGVGNRRTVKHGAYARVSKAELELKTRELFDALAEDAPVRAADGGLPAHDNGGVAWPRRGPGQASRCARHGRDVGGSARSTGGFQKWRICRN